jgi:hypothetical protein
MSERDRGSTGVGEVPGTDRKAATIASLAKRLLLAVVLSLMTLAGRANVIGAGGGNIVATGSAN